MIGLEFETTSEVLRLYRVTSLLCNQNGSFQGKEKRKTPSPFKKRERLLPLLLAKQFS